MEDFNYSFDSFNSSHIYDEVPPDECDNENFYYEIPDVKQMVE